MSFSQQDSKWAKTLLGYNTDPHFNLANFGCLVTAYANMLVAVTGDTNYTPVFVNDWLKANSGFLPGGGIMVWSVAAGLGRVQPKGTTSDLNAVKNFLKDPPNYAILEVSAGSNQHFVLGNTTSTIIDSQDGRQKSINTYPFVNAHLYRADTVAAAPSAPTINNTESPMTADQERQAYNIVLQRSPESKVPSGRTALQFILDAQGELSARRSADAAQLASATSELGSVKGQLSAANQQVQELLRKLQETQVKPVDFRDTYRPDQQVRVAVVDGTAHDFAGIKADQAVYNGMEFEQAGTFVVDGKTYVRTAISVANGDWYGTPLNLFGDPEMSISLTPGQTLHLKLSEVYGLLKRIQSNATNFIRGDK